MAHRNSRFLSPQGLRSGGTIAVALPAGTVADDFAPKGHRLSAVGTIFDDDDFSLLIIDDAILLTWSSSTSLPPGSDAVLVLALAESGEREVTALDGVDPTGEDDSTAGLATVLAAGGDIYFPRGTYKIAYAGADTGGVAVTVTKSIRVRCHPEARFRILCDNDAFRFTAPTGGVGLPDDGVVIEWRGGYFDQSGQPTSTSVPFLGAYPAVLAGASATCESLSFRGSYLDGATRRNGFTRVLVQGAEFHAGAHWQTSGGDTAIYCVDGTDITTIRGCVFTGCRDLGIYASRDSTGAAGGIVRVEDCRFVNCFYGASVKRGLEGFVITGNHFVNCVIGALANTLVGASAHGAIYGNTIDGCSVGIRLDWCENVSVFANPMLSLGALLADGTSAVQPYMTGRPAGVWLLGCTECTVRDHACSVVTAAYTTDQARLVHLENYDNDGTPVGSTLNLIEHCLSTDFYRVVEEEVGSLCDMNRVRACYNFGTLGIRDALLIGAATVEERINATTLKRNFHSGFHVGDGDAVAPIISRATQTGTGLFFAASKAAISVTGTERLGVSPTAITANVPVAMKSYTATQRDALTPATAWVLYNTTTSKLQVYSGGAWVDLH